MLKRGGKDDDEFLSISGGGLGAPAPDTAAPKAPSDPAPSTSSSASAASGGTDVPLILQLFGQTASSSGTDGQSKDSSYAPQGGQASGSMGGGGVVLTALTVDAAAISLPDAVSFDAMAGAMAKTVSLNIELSPAPDATGSDGAAPLTALAATPQSVTALSGGTSTTTTLNRIALENLKQGTPREVWALRSDIGDANIQGFATEISTNVGGTVSFKIATDSTHYRLEIYRMGYYGGDGARLVDVVDKQLSSAQIQPHPIVDASIGLIDAGNWSVSASWDIPADAVSGVYFAKLVREDGTAGENIIPFVVRDDSSHSDIVFQTSDTTWQAYNPWGGSNLYGGTTPLNPADMIAYMPPNCGCGLGAIGRGYAVSYNRPIITNTSTGFLAAGPQDFVFSEEFPAIQWLEQNGYDVSYVSGVDVARSQGLLLNHQVYLSVGHDEYWSGEQRANVTAARDAGVNLAFWGGNDCYWKVQWNESIDGNGTPYRTMTCYKDTWANTDINPAAGSTATWRDTRFADPGQEPENSLIGTMFSVDSWRTDTISIPYEMTQLRFWRNTAISNTLPGQSGQLVNGLLGYEWNSDVDNGFRPAGLINLSLSNIAVDTYLLDYGNTVGPGNATHSLTMYRDQQSGALVFSAGSVMWSWGLNAQHELEGVPVDPNVQQAMVNMFADMGVQPTTLDASLMLASQSTDHQAPVASVTSPQAGAAYTEGQRFTITGTAQDLGGGRVAGIEVSVDGGTTWRKADGTTNWSYTWIAQASGTYNIVARATDDSLNIGAASTGTQIQVTLPSTSSLWTYANKPVNALEYERNSVELGVKFSAATGGTIDGIRFYKGPLNIGTHTGSLWTSTGTLLATGTFSNESSGGWQTLMFTTPITVQAGQLYIASYHTSGYYSADTGYFNTTYQSGLLSSPIGAGVYVYGTGGDFPGQSSDTNYWVDVVFTSTAVNTVPVAHDDNVRGGWNVPLVLSAAQLLGNDTDADGDALRILSVGNATHGTVAFDSVNNAVTYTPDSGYSGAGTFTYTISDGRGGTSTATVNVDVKQGIVGASLFSAANAPSGPPQQDPGAVELGVKFTVSMDGTITGIRYYKSAQDTGTHTGSLWTSTGVLLATATFSNETASGWQTLTFANPISVTANTTYVASYHSNGYYVADGGYFNANHTSGPLTALSSATAGGNGVFTYGSTSQFPTGTYGAANYWVDVTFDSLTGGNHNPVAANDSGFNTNTNTPIVIAVSSLLANDHDADGDPLTVTGVSGASHGSVSFDAVAGTVTFTPDAGYFGAGGFSYTVSDGKGGTASAAVEVQVTSATSGTTLFGASDGSSAAQSGDPGAVELGVKFLVSATGTITGIRYYKSAQDTGTHTGSLWTSTGTLLASATFANESSSGWQMVYFSSPVTVSAGTTYVASFHSNGYYVATNNYFATDHTSGALTAPAGSNGVYAYGATSQFPTQSYSNSNYWVDVVYQQAVNSNPVANNDTGLTAVQNSALVIAANTLLANDTDADGDPLSITGVSGANHGSVSYNAVNKTITFTPDSGYAGAANFTYAISDGRGGTSSATVSLQVEAQQSGAGQSLFADTAAPTQFYQDNTPVQLGMTFQADVAGTITGIRFYKAANDNGPHTANLWTSTGTQLASATTTSESASGWQTVMLTQPVSISANTQYVVSYGSQGTYGATGDFFSAQLTSGHLSAPSGANGLYAYGTGDVFPTSSFNKTNYYVDVIFQPLAA